MVQQRFQNNWKITMDFQNFTAMQMLLEKKVAKNLLSAWKWWTA